MSPRAAWRLDAFGYGEVYDYVAGKADWMAAGLITERAAANRPRVSDVVDRSVATCGPADRLADVVKRFASRGADMCVVVNERGVVQGRIRFDRVEPTTLAGVEESMEPGPTTIRADADLADTRERMRRRGAASLVVTDPDGVLLGVVYAAARGPAGP